MPIFVKDDCRVLYVHVPKTGGSLVYQLFLKNGFDRDFFDLPKHGFMAVKQCSPQHLHAEVLQSLLRLDAFDYTFMTIRNPVSRIVSEYKWRQADPEKMNAQDFHAWFVKAHAGYRRNPFGFFDPIVDLAAPQARFCFFQDHLPVPPDW